MNIHLKEYIFCFFIVFALLLTQLNGKAQNALKLRNKRDYKEKISVKNINSGESKIRIETFFNKRNTTDEEYSHVIKLTLVKSLLKDTILVIGKHETTIKCSYQLVSAWFDEGNTSNNMEGSIIMNKVAPKLFIIRFELKLIDADSENKIMYFGKRLIRIKGSSSKQFSN